MTTEMTTQHRTGGNEKGRGRQRLPMIECIAHCEKVQEYLGRKKEETLITMKGGTEIAR